MKKIASPVRLFFGIATVALAPPLAGPVPAAAQVAITQQNAMAGNVTPGDAPDFPITLSEPGSYVLRSNLHVPSGRNGIEITTFDVTIDLNGFRLHGGGVANEGIVAPGSVGDPGSTVTIKNGLVAGFRRGGIIGLNFWTVQDMHILVNGVGGVALAFFGRVLRSTIAYNGGIGIICTSCLIEDNLITNNTSDGILSNATTVLGNTIAENAGFGISADGTTGFGNNTLFKNNGGGPQARGAEPLRPNFCTPAC